MRVFAVALVVLSGACQGKIEAGPAPTPASGPPAAASSARGFEAPDLPPVPAPKPGLKSPAPPSAAPP